jgi:hypothetical protein
MLKRSTSPLAILERQRSRRVKGCARILDVRGVGLQLTTMPVFILRVRQVSCQISVGRYT